MRTNRRVQSGRKRTKPSKEKESRLRRCWLSSWYILLSYSPVNVLKSNSVYPTCFQTTMYVRSMVLSLCHIETHTLYSFARASRMSTLNCYVSARLSLSLILCSVNLCHVTKHNPSCSDQFKNKRVSNEPNWI